MNESKEENIRIGTRRRWRIYRLKRKYKYKEGEKSHHIYPVKQMVLEEERMMQ